MMLFQISKVDKLAFEFEGLGGGFGGISTNSLPVSPPGLPLAYTSIQYEG